MPTREREGSGTGVADATRQRASAALRAFAALGTPRWWQGRHGQALLISGQNYWEDRWGGIRLRPIQPSVLPSIVPNAGLGGATAIRTGAADPVGMLISPAGTTIIPQAGPWTIWGVSKAGTSAASCLASVPGVNGGPINILHRSSNIFAVVTRDAADVATTQVSVPVPSTDIVLWMVCRDAAANTFTVWINGALAGTSNAAALAPHSGRLAVLGGWDTGINGGQGGVSHGQFRGGDLYALGFDGTVNVGANADYRARLRAMLLDQYPTGLTIAA